MHCTLYLREREMSNNHRSKLSHLMPNSWFYKLRDMKRPRTANQRSSEARRSSKTPRDQATTTLEPLNQSPFRYHHTNSATAQKPRNAISEVVAFTSPSEPEGNRFSISPKPSSISRTSATETAEGDYEIQDLPSLRPIRTRAEPT
jgi:16S rRNA C967 or C1407 C5-methylase (RsmB/RsmF family)